MMIDIAPEDTDVIVGFEDSVTVQTLDGITVGLLDSITVGFEDSVTVPLLTAIALDSDTTVDPVTVNGPSVESATTKAAMVDVTVLEPATTLA